MRRGVNALLFTAALATTACVTDSGKLEVRPVADPFTKATKAGNPLLAEGRGLLAVGSVGLAIEAFRKALREQPDSIEALAGLAECYDQMGRHDLSRAKYEAALAIAPNNVTLLRTFAASLERQGRYADAKALRAEAAETELSAAAVLARIDPAAPVAAQPQAAPAAVSLAAVHPRPAPKPVTAVAPQLRSTPAQAQAPAMQPKLLPAPVKATAVEPAAAPAPVRIAEAHVDVASAPVAGRTEWKIEAQAMAPLPTAQPSVTVKLPPARAEAPKAPVARTEPAKVAIAEAPRAAVATIRPEPAKVAIAAPSPAQAPAPAAVAPPRVEVPKVEIAAGPSVTVKLPPARPASLPPEKPSAPVERPAIAAATPPHAGPRLERVSLGEVALITRPRMPWITDTIRYARIGSAPRFVPLAELQRKSGVRLLNAARQDGLAARTRIAFNRHGWTRVTIGDSPRMRQKSLILYSRETEQAARRLAARYGIWIAKEARPGPLTILLGRDWVSRRAPRA